MSSRHYLFPAEGDPLRIPQRVIDGLVHDLDSLPAFANTKQRVLHAYVELSDGNPVRILETTGVLWDFDEDGCVGDSIRKAVALRADPFDVPEPGSTVVSLQPVANRRKLKDEHRWQPSKQDIERVIADIWPKQPSDRLRMMKGTAKRREALTWEARRTLDSCSEGFWKIDHEIARLKEPSLKSFAFHARQRADEPHASAPLFHALAEIAEWYRELGRRKRSGKGTWYAVLEVTAPRDNGITETIRTYSEQRDGRKAATEAARQLVIEHADKITEHSTIYIDVITDLEWDQQGFEGRAT